MRKNCQRFHHSTHVYQKPQSYEAHGVRQFFFCHFGLFVALYTPQEPRNSNFEKMKKASGDVIIINFKKHYQIMHPYLDR